MSLFTYTEAEFMEWLKVNRTHLSTYTSDEVAHLAMACGFGSEMVYRILSHFERAMEGRNIDRDADFQTQITEMTIKDVAKMKEPKPFDMRPYWKDLADHNTTGKEVA